MSNSVDIVIVNWNSGSLLRDCLLSISDVSQQDEVSARVIVLDNASSDGSCDQLPKLDCPLQAVKNVANVGFAAACNQGARLCDGDFLLFLNPDTRLLPGSLKMPLQTIQQPENSRIGICGVQMLGCSGQVARHCARFPSLGNIVAKMLGISLVWPSTGMAMLEWNHLQSRQVDQVMGAFLLVRRKVFDTVNGFDERFFLYFEDVDFSLRVRQAGWENYYLADAKIFHEEGGTSKQIKGRRLSYFLGSRILYAGKHFAWPLAIAHLAITLMVESPARLLFALARGRLADVGNLLHGTGLLWLSLPELMVRHWRASK